jgi:hypothetical protein
MIYEIAVFLRKKSCSGRKMRPEQPFSLFFFVREYYPSDRPEAGPCELP